MITIGQILKRERLRKKLTLSQVEEATKIKESFLDAVEKGEYTKLPSSTYAQGFVLSYAQFLGLPKKEAGALFRREFDEKKSINVLPKSFTSSGEISVNRRKIPGSLFAIIGILLIIFVYLFFQYKAAFFSPPLNISSPQENTTISGPTITVVGNTDANASVTVNSSEVAVDDSGNFRKTVTLFPGNQTINVVATNKFGKTSTVLRHVTVKNSS